MVKFRPSGRLTGQSGASNPSIAKMRARATCGPISCPSRASRNSIRRMLSPWSLPSGSLPDAMSSKSFRASSSTSGRVENSAGGAKMAWIMNGRPALRRVRHSLAADSLLRRSCITCRSQSAGRLRSFSSADRQRAAHSWENPQCTCSKAPRCLVSSNSLAGILKNENSMINISIKGKLILQKNPKFCPVSFIASGEIPVASSWRNLELIKRLPNAAHLNEACPTTSKLSWV